MERIDEMLDEMGRYGQVILMGHRDGTWSCNLTLRLAPGVDTALKSGSEHKTSLDAVRRTYGILQSVLATQASATEPVPVLS